jgi:hypothetical protein
MVKEKDDKPKKAVSKPKEDKPTVETPKKAEEAPITGAAVVEKPVELAKEVKGLIPFEVWFNIKRKKRTHFRAMQVYAMKHARTNMLTLEGWDKVFERF